jgi:glycosyltransferase involved in cell wall biosynthesis
MTKHKSTKVLVYGNVFRDYRSQVLIELLLDLGYHVSLICPDFYLTQRRSLFNWLYLIELAIKARSADAIYLSPMNTRFINSALWAAKTFGKKLIVEMYISIYDTFVGDRKPLKGKQIEAGTRLAKSMRSKDILALTKSDFIIHTAQHEPSYWEKLLEIEIERQKVAIAPNFNVSDLVRSNKTRDGTLRICWWGTFIPLHGLDNILQAMQILQQQGVRFTCSLFGVDNDLFATYRQKIEQARLQDWVYLRKDLRFSDRSLPEYLVNHCDLALGIFGNTAKANNAIPNKLIEALSMALPTLTRSSPALSEFFAPNDLWTCQSDPEAIAQAIMAIAQDAAPPVDWQATRAKVLATFSVTKYRDVVEQVLERATKSPAVFERPTSLKNYEQQISQTKC